MPVLKMGTGRLAEDKVYFAAEDLALLLTRLANYGCYPCLSLRGKNIWRFHINGAGNFWGEGSTPISAAKQAVKLWLLEGKPIDGYGDCQK